MSAKEMSGPEKNRSNEKKLLYALLAVLAVGVILCLRSPAILPAGAADVSDFERVSPFSAKSLWLVRQARAIIENYQVDADTKSITEEQLVQGAIKGMVESWKDPYTRFVAPDQLREEEIEMEGQYGGLGMYIGDRDGRILVISPIEDTPADRAGLKPMDQIVKVGDEVALGWDSQEVVKRLRGKPDTAVTIWIRRENEEELLKFEMVREIIKIKSVRYEMLSDDIGYLRLTQFKQKTDREAEEALKTLIDGNAKGLVLDLRNNGGGLLNVCVNISSMFLKGGSIVGTRGRVEKANEDYYADPAKYLTDLPMVVLINEGSASASEILAGALGDRDRAILVGKKSFGKGSVQTLFNLTDGSGIYVTIARYHTPSGKVIDHVGLTPNVEVEGQMNRDYVKDAQLQRALSELKKQILKTQTTASSGARKKS
ncbi:MAG: S41 family peptidase [Synergistaceae bacterium]|jgi:carboxyl-terminal processing protease|nr:S41 family peptidase [Synergistaceae bacterium]